MVSRPTFPASGALTQPVAAKLSPPKGLSTKVTPAKAMTPLVRPATQAKREEAPRRMAPMPSDTWAIAHQKKLMERLRADPLIDPRVIEAMGRTPRHCFVDSALATQAYEDTSLPIGLGQTISKPSIVARMLSLMLQKGPSPLFRVLEIGSGCGYQATVISHLAKEVYSIERLRQLHDKARSNVRQLLVPNLHLLLGDGMLGFEKGAPYDAIVSAAGGDSVPQAWVDQLAVGGCIIAPTVVTDAAGRAQGQSLVLLEKTRNGLTRSVYEPVQFVPLKSGLA